MAFKRFNAKPTATIGGSSTPKALVILNLILRFLQSVFALAVIGLYAQNISHARTHQDRVEKKWTFAVVVGALSAITCLVYVIPKLKSWWAFGWDWALFILWTAVFGLFGNIYIHQNPRGDSGIKRMKNAVWIDLVNMLLWLVTAVMATVAFFSLRGGRSIHTGRAAV